VSMSIASGSMGLWMWYWDGDGDDTEARCAQARASGLVVVWDSEVAMIRAEFRTWSARDCSGVGRAWAEG
jgi:hypothetical protein